MRNAYNILVRKPEEMMPFWRPMHRWRENIKRDLKETVCVIAWVGYTRLRTGSSFIKNNVSETGFCLHPQARAYSVGPNRQSKSLSPETEISPSVPIG
jgi:hypothetical protein